MGKVKSIILTDSERLSLEAGFRNGSSHCFRMRCRSILLKSAGFSSKAIGLQTEMSHVSVNFWVKRFLAEGFNERQTATLINGKPLFYEGELYSEEHKRKFTTERAGFQVVKDPKDRSKLALAINGQLIGEWFREQFNRLFSSVKKTVEPLRIGKGMGL